MDIPSKFSNDTKKRRTIGRKNNRLKSKDIVKNQNLKKRVTASSVRNYESH